MQPGPLEMPSTQRLEALFEHDHDRLLALLDDVQALCRQGSYVPAARVFGEFRILQEQHLDREAEALASLEARGACPAGVTSGVTREHAALKAHIARAWSEITGGDHARFDATMAALCEAVSVHERDERDRLLPLLRESVRGAPEIATAVRRLVE